jgi:hypothetical protein
VTSRSSMPGTEVTKNDKAQRYAAPEIFATGPGANYQTIEAGERSSGGGGEL